MTSTTNQTEQLNQTITEENEALEQLPFTVHLIELRRRLIKCVGLIIALFEGVQNSVSVNLTRF